MSILFRLISVPDMSKMAKCSAIFGKSGEFYELCHSCSCIFFFVRRNELRGKKAKIYSWQ